MQKSLTEARLSRRIDLLPALDREVKRPEQLRNAEKEVAFGKVDAGADAPAGAVAVVVALVPLAGRGVGGGEGGVGFEALGDEVLGVLPGGGVVVHGPDVEDDGGAFGQEHAVDFAVWGVC